MIILYENKGAGNSWNRYEIITGFPGACSATFFDVNWDGTQDIVASSYYGSRISWFESDESGYAWEEHVIATGISGPMDFDVFEIDDVIEGTAIVLCSNAEDALYILVCSDTVGLQWSQNLIADDLFGISTIDGADLDNDDDIDYLVTGYDCNTIWLFECVAWFGYEQYTFDDDVAGPTDARWADVEGDGDLDAVSCSYEDGIIHWYKNQGDDTWIRRMVCHDLSAVSGLCVSDMTLLDDEFLGIGAVSCNSGRVLRYECTDSDGDSWQQYVVGLLPGATNLSCVELDGIPGMELLAGAGLDQQLRYWSLDQHMTSGALNSSVLDTEASPSWDCMSWTDITPRDAVTGFQVRSSNDPEQMGEWSDVFYHLEDLSEYLADGTRYIQYRVVMESSSPSQTPILDELSVSWNPTGIEPEPDPEPECLLTILSPNPASGTIDFAIQGTQNPCSVHLVDLSGRVLCTLQLDAGDACENSVDTTELHPGLYFLRAEAGELSDSHSLMIL
jgi:hypothetical protein